MLLSLQYLRGIAAVMIVYYHATGPLERLTGVRLPTSFSGFGVDLFFVLSGFVMWLSTYRKDSSPREFLTNRLTRIAPLYWAITLFVAAIALLAPSLLRSTTFDLPHLIASLAFIPWPNPSFPGLWPIVIPGWTLNYEMFFYLVFGLLLPLAPPSRAIGTVAVLGGLTLAGAILQPDGIAGFYTAPILLEFGFGVLIGTAYTSAWTVSRPLSLTVALIGAALCPVFFHTGQPHLVTFGIPGALVVGGLAFFEKTGPVWKIQPLQHLGDASYSLYLSHTLVLAASAIVLNRLGVMLPWPAMLAVLLIVCILAGSSVYIAVESPITRLARGKPTSRHLEPALPSVPHLERGPLRRVGRHVNIGVEDAPGA